MIASTLQIAAVPAVLITRTWSSVRPNLKSPNFNFFDGGQHSEQSNVQRPIFRNIEISNIKRTEDELFFLLLSNLFLFL